MRVFVAGASGAIGRPLVRQLLEAGHEVTGTTRREERAEEMRAAGANAVVCDVFDAAALGEAVKAARPEVVVNELTSLPRRYEPRKASFYEATDRVRGEGGRNLLEASLAAGARTCTRCAKSRCWTTTPGSVRSWAISNKPVTVPRSSSRRRRPKRRCRLFSS